jgi:hypothetical protein
MMIKITYDLKINDIMKKMLLFLTALPGQSNAMIVIEKQM